MRTPPEPTTPLALGLMVGLERDLAHLPAAVVSDPGHEITLMRAIAEREGVRGELEQARGAGHRAGGALAQANQGMAEVVPRLEKLKAQSESLRMAQSQEAEQEAMRRLRRERAELNVQLEDVQRIFDDHLGEARMARETLLGAQNAQLRLADTLRRQDAELAVLLAREPKVGAVLGALTLKLGYANSRLFVALHEPRAKLVAAAQSWRDAFYEVSEAVEAAHENMAQGRQSERVRLAFEGGRAVLTAEVVWGLVALGDLAGARLAFGRMCGGATFLHAISDVFRAFACGHLLLGDAQLDELVEVLRLHRFEQSARGALAAAIWCYLDEDAAGFRRAQRRLARAEWQAHWQAGRPTLGLLGLPSLALARLAHQAGLPIELSFAPHVPIQLLNVFDALPKAKAG